MAAKSSSRRLNELKLERHIRACRGDLHAFMQYTWMGPGEFCSGPHIRAMCSALTHAVAQFERGISTNLRIQTPFRHGKALHVDTPIFTLDGWKRMGDIKVGDYVYAPDGTATRVVAVSPTWHDRPLYKVSFNNRGEVIYADGEHEWVARKPYSTKMRIVTTRELAAYKSKYNFRYAIRIAAPLVGNPAVKLPIPPYTLGLWLGDGTSAVGAITSGDLDRSFIQDEVIKDGYQIRLHKNPVTYGITGLQVQLRAIGVLNNKHIPDDYLKAPYTDRLALLQGLIDTDGSVSKSTPRPGRNSDLTGGQVSFTNVNKRLAYNVLDLIRSLGVRASLQPFRAMLNGRDICEAYRISFYMKDCCRLLRKRERTRNSTKYIDHTIHAEATDMVGDTVCIQVAHPSHQYLCGKSLVPTHNSMLVSRYLPAYMLGRCQLLDPSILLSGYGAALVHDASQDCRRLIGSERYARVFPNIRVDPACGAVDNWRISGSAGRVVAVGLGGAMTGRGYHLGVLDDYCKNRAEAESAAFRETTWRSFTNDFLTRRQSPAITIVCATPWHVDDISGRIKVQAGKDPHFPQFMDLVFPARNPDGTFLWENYLGRDWYLGHYAALTPYESSGLLDCDPVVHTGGMFDADRFKIIPAGSVDLSSVVRAYRYFDKAATHQGGCFTAGVLLLSTKDRRLIVYDVVRGQWDSAERERKMLEIAQRDRELFGPKYRIGIEQEPGSGGVDSARLTVSNLAGFIVDVDKVTGSKTSRAQPWASQVNAGRVELVQAVWNAAYMDEHRQFPSGRYVDTVDASAGAFSMSLGATTGNIGSGGLFTPRTTF